jgi:mono/diheme cytochrome c family protein
VPQVTTQRVAIVLIAAAAVLTLATAVASPQNSQTPLFLHAHRQSPLDLEIGGDLLDQPPNSGTAWYLTRKVLLAMPQTSYTVTDDPNFSKPTKVSGVLLSDLIASAAAHPESDIAVAICSDKYRANYSREYLATHQPLLVLEIDGQPPSGWPRDGETHSMTMGPYLVSHPKYFPGSAAALGGEETQVPWSVVRIDFQSEKEVFASIEPRGKNSTNATVRTGYQIAKQNCFRCHNSGAQGGQKSGVPWTILATLASAAPDHFTAYIRNPQAQDPQAQMPPNPDYDDASLQALTAYFQTFAPARQPEKKP